jgi:hypothetical protein
LGPFSFFSSFIKKNLAGLPVKYIIGDSLTAHRLIKNSSVTLCFIDGDHRTPVIEQDLDNYWPKVKKGGIFAGHDYNAGWPDVARAVNEKFLTFLEKEMYGSIWVVRK